jgi:hypothetical protein
MEWVADSKLITEDIKFISLESLGKLVGGVYGDLHSTP